MAQVIVIFVICVSEAIKSSIHIAGERAADYKRWLAAGKQADPSWHQCYWCWEGACCLMVRLDPRPHCCHWTDDTDEDTEPEVGSPDDSEDDCE